MNEQVCLSKMVAPGQVRPSKPYRGGVIQIIVTRACNRACYHCTQGSQLGGKTTFMTPEQFGQAIESLRGYWGVIGVFGGNPAVSIHFEEYCKILGESWVPFEQRGLWCNDPITREKCFAMRRTFCPSVSNLNVHQDSNAYKMFRTFWPECRPVGLNEDSRHSPVHLAMKDIITDESRRWELISGCDVNHFWSAAVGVFRGQLRAWFCEIAASQSILHQDDPNYPDTGLDLMGPFVISEHPYKEAQWWQLPMTAFAHQVRKHCHECSVPLRGYGELANAPDDKGVEQTSQTHADIYKPKRKDRRVELVIVESQLGKRLEKVTKYIQNASK